MTKRSRFYFGWKKYLKEQERGEVFEGIIPAARRFSTEGFDGLIPIASQKGVFDFLYDPELGMKEPKIESFNFASFEFKYSKIPAMDKTEFKDSFAMVIPKDISRYPDGRAGVCFPI